LRESPQPKFLGKFTGSGLESTRAEGGQSTGRLGSFHLWMESERIPIGGENHLDQGYVEKNGRSFDAMSRKWPTEPGKEENVGGSGVTRV